MTLRFSPRSRSRLQIVGVDGGEAMLAFGRTAIVRLTAR